MIVVKLRKKVVRSGNSFALRLTKEEAKRLGVQPGDDVEVDISPTTPGLRLDPSMFFHDGRGSINHDQEVADAIAQGG